MHSKSWGTEGQPHPLCALQAGIWSLFWFNPQPHAVTDTTAAQKQSLWNGTRKGRSGQRCPTLGQPQGGAWGTRSCYLVGRAPTFSSCMVISFPCSLLLSMRMSSASA